MKRTHPRNNLEFQDAYLVGVHRYSLRAGEPAKIVNVVCVNPSNAQIRNAPIRPCFHIIFEDGKEDWIPIEDSTNYKIISEDDYQEGQIPPVTE